LIDTLAKYIVVGSVAELVDQQAGGTVDDRSVGGVIGIEDADDAISVRRGFHGMVFCIHPTLIQRKLLLCSSVHALGIVMDVAACERARADPGVV
jgi:hypothetical protein